MARTRRRTAKKSQALKPWQLILLVLVLGAGYLYQQGFFDRWLDDYGMAFNQTAQPDSSGGSTKPTAVPVGGSGGPEVELTKAATASGDWYQVYFTRPVYPDKRDQRTGGVDTAIAADIANAKESVNIAVFEFDSPAITDALLDAHERGLAIQMVLDDHTLESPESAEQVGKLEEVGIPITYDRRSAFMHNKIVILDNAVVWAGSMNLKMSEIYRNNNNMVRATVAPLVENYQQRFRDLFAGKMGGSAPANTPNPVIDLANGVRIENYFSPSDGPRAHLLEYLGSAQRSVKMLAFSFTDDATAETLIDLHNKGVDVQIVMEARSETGTGSEFGVVQEAGINILPDGNCFIQHNKVMIIDDRVVVTGSYNFTGNAENNNDENMLIISDPTLAAHFSDNFALIQEQAINPTVCGG